ncbi:GNAT family N-acetyltransferase [Cellulomonas fulva]|uniref:GNAT family N-acetyltransferase n=1 Tax=Cellulomonas fulva TaxID=2835530 RepID=UPI0027DCAB83|nr:GNAT family N-acetyltransferase [Cellulomonas fulva]
MDVVEVPDGSRFEARDGERVLGFAEYHRDGRTVVFTHTEVGPEHEGQGVGGELVRGALDAVRDRGDDVVALCPFVSAWIARHPEYRDLLREAAPGSSGG